MGWSFKITRIAGTEIRIHGTFLILLGWYGMMDYEAGGIKSALSGSAFILLLFTCVVLHELGHALAAKRYGIHTPDITLLPIGGIARLEKLPDDPRQEIVVALAGPAVNVAIAGLLFLGMGGALPHSSDLLALETGKGNLFVKLFFANVMLVLFNLIPAFPMDGGRVLRASLAIYTNRARATVIAARIGQAVAVLFGLAGFYLPNVILAIIGIFIFLMAQQEIRFALLKRASEKISVAQVLAPRFLALPFNLPVEAAAQEITREPMSEYPLVDGQLHVRGMVSQQQILKALSTCPAAPLLQIGFQPPTIPIEMPCWEAVEIMQREGWTSLAVINPEGQVVGLLSLSELTREPTVFPPEAKKS